MGFKMVFINEKGERFIHTVATTDEINARREQHAARECHVVGYEPRDSRSIHAVQSALVAQ